MRGERRSCIYLLFVVHSFRPEKGLGVRMTEKRTIPSVDEELLGRIVSREKDGRTYEMVLQILRDHYAKQDAGSLTEEPSAEIGRASCRERV